MTLRATADALRHLCLAITALALFAGTAHAQSSVRPPDAPASLAPSEPGETRIPDAPIGELPAGTAPVDIQPSASQSELWGELRHGAEGIVSIPDAKAGVLVQDAGMEWVRANAAGSELHTYGAYAIGGIVVLLLLFYLLRGRIRIEHGRAGRTIRRFSGLERFAHWLMAVSFVILALSGLNLLYGQDVLVALFAPSEEDGGVRVAGAMRYGWGLLGADGYESVKPVYATLALYGKLLHNTVAFAFMLGILLAFVLWVLRNLPDRTDINWILKGGGLFSKGVHPPAKKFNFGQKIVFWSVVVLGASISASGLALMFPFELALFSKTFGALNAIGFDLNANLTPIQEMQYSQLWHSIVGFGMIVVIIAHIYIGSVGMEGAFSAMGSGDVDLNWAKEHHSLWVKEVEESERQRGKSAPAGATPAE